MPRCSPPRSSALGDAGIAAALDDWRRSADRRRRRSARPNRQHDAARRAHDRDSRRRPARPHDGARRRGARLSRHVFADGGRLPGRPGLRPRDRRAVRRCGGARALCRRRSMSPPSSSRTSRPRRCAASPPPCRSHPRPEILEIAQDRLRRRIFCARSASPRPIPGDRRPGRARCRDRANSASPAVLKTVRMGYDGKGQVMIRAAGDSRCRLARDGRRRSASSKALSISRCEISVVVARGGDGAMAAYPAGRKPPRQPYPRYHDRAGRRRRPRWPARPKRSRATSPSGSISSGCSRSRCLLRKNGRAAGQRNRAAPAQFRPLDDRRLHDEPVRAVGAGDLRPAARLDRAPLRRRDEEPDRRRDRRAWREHSPTRTPSCTSTARPSAAGPQDGPRHPAAAEAVRHPLPARTCL